MFYIITGPLIPELHHVQPEMKLSLEVLRDPNKSTALDVDSMELSYTFITCCGLDRYS